MKKITLLMFVGLFMLIGYIGIAEALVFTNSCLWTDIWDVDVSGDYAYCIGPYGLQVLNISNPAFPTLVARLMLQQTPLRVGGYNYLVATFGIDVEGTKAYVANWDGNGHGTLHIIDVSDPSHPQLLSSLKRNHYASDIKVAGGYAYVAQTYSGLMVYNVSNPSSPVVAGSYPTLYAQGVALTGEYAYVADGSTGLKIINISNPTQPTLIGNCDTPDEAIKVCVQGNFAYVADNRSDGQRAGLQIIDISIPTAPVIVGSLDTRFNAVDVAVSGNYCYVVDIYDNLLIVDVTNPTAPRLITTFDEVPNVSCSIVLSSSHAFVAGALGGGLQIINVTNPSIPSLVGYYETPGQIKSVAFKGHYAYVTDGFQGGLRIVDVVNPYRPVEVGAVKTPDQANDIAIFGHYAFIADRYSGVQIVDINDSEHPLIVSSVLIPGSQSWAFGVAVLGDYLYVGATSRGLQVINISNPLEPTLAGYIETPGLAGRLAVKDSLAFVTYWGAQKGLSIIDITNPYAPTLVNNYPTSSGAYEVAVDGNYVYLGGDDFGLLILDVSSPASPILVGTYNNNQQDIWGIKVQGDSLFISDISKGLTILGIADRSSPVLLDTISTRGQAFDVAVGGNFVYVADLYGMSIFSFCLDTDGDGVCDSFDNCPITYNPNQSDINGNGIGDACELYAYLPGDANMYVGMWPPAVTSADVTYLVGYFRGLNYPCLLDTFFCTADINGDCHVNGADVTRLVRYFKGLNGITPCPNYPSAWPPLPDEAPAGWPDCETSR